VCIKNISNTFKVSAIHGRFCKNDGGLLGFYTLWYMYGLFSHSNKHTASNFRVNEFDSDACETVYSSETVE
jgi:hypothetical protein